MSDIILITGGARSGKSSYAEKLLESCDDVLYLATAIRTDEEMTRRIAHHIQFRNPKWATHEGYQNFESVLADHSQQYILLDCVTNMISNLLFYNPRNPEEMTQDEENELFLAIKNEFKNLLDCAIDQDRQLILVSNEVGMGLISEYKLGRLFVDFAGFINQYLATRANRVYFMVSGLPLTIKE